MMTTPNTFGKNSLPMATRPCSLKIGLTSITSIIHLRKASRLATHQLCISLSQTFGGFSSCQQRTTFGLIGNVEDISEIYFGLTERNFLGMLYGGAFCTGGAQLTVIIYVRNMTLCLIGQDNFWKNIGSWRFLFLGGCGLNI